MSKLLCACGHVIRDQTDELPYKASLTPDANAAKLLDGIEQALQELLMVRTEADRERWLARFGFTGIYPRDLPLATMAMDLLTSRTVSLSKDCYECTACGRLHVQRGMDGEAFVAYSPDGGRYEGVLRPDSPAPTEATPER